MRKYWDISGLTNKFVYNEAETLDEYKIRISNVFKDVFNGGISLKEGDLNYKTDEELVDYWIVIEPTYMIFHKINGTGYHFYGTQYELATLSNLGPGLANITNVVLPCSSVVTGEIAKNKSNIPGVSGNSYFNGTLQFVDLYSSGATNYGKSIHEHCSNPISGDTLPQSYLTGNYGTGIGLLWGGSLLNQELEGPSCEKVEKVNKSIKSELQRASDLGNIESFKDLYQGTINYENSKGELKETTVDWYIENCPPKPKLTTYNCTPKFNVGNCLKGDNIYYKDGSYNSESDEYWNNCVFEDKGHYLINTHKVSKPKIGGSLSHYDKSLGGNYCEVYCVEELSTDFGKSVKNVMAGKHFLWMDHSVSGSRTCKTKEIDWNKYMNDINIANGKVEKTYVDWQLEEKKRDNINSASVETSSSSCSCIYSSHGISCCSSASVHSYSCYCGDGKRDSMNCCDEDGKNCACGDAVPDSRSCSCGYVCDTPDDTRYDLYTADAARFTLHTEHGNVSDSWSGTNWCSNTSKPSTNVSFKKIVYNNALAVAKGITKEMTKCYDWNVNNIYNLNPVLSIAYSDNTYIYGDPLNTNTKYNPVSTDSDCVKVTAPNYTGCSGTHCYTNASVYKCGYNNETRSAVSTFDFNKKGIFQYVLKNNNESFHSYELASQKQQGITTNYIDIGYSNFPVAYKTSDGIYGAGTHNGGELSLYYSKLGHMISGSTALDSILSQKPVDMNDDYGKWQCEFNVSSNLITGDDENAGINLIYRPIDLDYPFPDMDASGRNTGDNWCYFNDCNNNNQNVEDVIKNNRDVKGDDVYHKEPMYSFTLTPTDIKEIRKYNKENSYTEYTGTFGGKTYDFVCDKGTGEHCISEYLTKLIDMVGNGGSCTTSKARNTNLNSDFESCRY